MNAERWPRLKELFHQAIERAPEERASFLDDVCGDEGELRAELERLLTAHAKAEGFIESSPVSGLAQRAAAATSLTGRVVGRYEIGRLIGSGGMGQVYVARDVELGRAVALKVIGRDTLEAHATLRREAQNASQLNHPHICTIHEIGAFDGRAYIVMEYVEGQPLSELVPADGMPTETMLRYGMQIADALAHAHHRGVIHRDLKTANVAVGADGRAKILDFGLALGTRSAVEDMSRSRAPLRSEEPLAGTLCCMAPELLRGEPASARSDIWSLGVLLYEMAAGQRPFGGTTPFEVSANILHATPPPLPARVPAALQAVVQRCLAKDPRERYSTADEVRAALVAIQARHTRGDPRARVIWSAARLHRPHVALIAVFALIALIALGFAITRRGTTATEASAVGASGRPAVAVMIFETVTDTPNAAWLARGVPNMLLTGLAQTRGLDIVSAERLQEALKQRGEEKLESLDQKEMADIARLAGAGAAVVGSIYSVGPEIRIDAQVNDLATGRVLAAESVRGTDVFALVDQLAARVRTGLGFEDAPDVRRIADVSSPSLAAYRLYSEGMDAAVNLRWQEAQQRLEEATAIDPMFAEAHLRLVIIQRNAGGTTKQREHLRLAAEHAHRLGPRHRLLLEFELAREQGDAKRMASLLDETLARFPDFLDAYHVASVLYHPTAGLHPDAEKLLSITRSGATMMPSSAEMRNTYGYALIAAGRFDEALAQFEQYLRLAPREPNPLDSLGDVYLLLGQPEKAVELYMRAVAIDPTFGSQNGRAYALALLGRYDEALGAEARSPYLRAVLVSRVGRYREAAQILDAGMNVAQSEGNQLLLGNLYLTSSMLALERQDYTKVLRDATRSRDHIPIGRPSAWIADTMCGLAEVAMGRVADARARLEAQSRVYRRHVPLEAWWHHVLKGEIEIAEGDVAKAAESFSLGTPWRTFLPGQPQTVLTNNLVLRDGPARIAVRRGEIANAIQIYRQLLSYGPDQKWMSVFEPRYVLQLARLLERSGDKHSALEQYRRFLSLWRQADADLPELADARSALKRLQ